MRSAWRLLLRAAGRAVLNSAALLIPTTHRTEWLMEWRGELWQVEHATAARNACRSARQCFLFCLGAVPDAIELRRMARAGGCRRSAMHRSAGYCLLGLVSILAAGWAVALRSTSVMAELHSARYALRPDLVYIKHASAPDWTASISATTFKSWAGTEQRYFSGFAFYLAEQGELKSRGKKSVVTYLMASDNLFELAGLSVELGSVAAHGQQGLVLSDALWRSQFGADPRIVGREVRLGDRRVRVIAIAPDGLWRMPGTPEAWLLLPDELLPAAGQGIVLARMKPEGWRSMFEGRVSIQAFGSNGYSETLSALSLVERTQGPWGICLLSLLLAFLALPAVASVSLVDDVFAINRTTRSRQMLRWGFLGCKFALLLAIVFILPLDAIYLGKPGYQPDASGMQWMLTLGLSLVGMWWVIADQRKRCPVCLRRVTHPARVGLAARTFLAWNGTELMCTGGHTLLEIPSLPTSWFDTPRWVYLDESWETLFAA